MTREIINITTGEVNYDDEVSPPVTADEVRSTRNQLLASSDWTQVQDAPVDQASWAAYRQSLRDISAQSGFPEAVVWPEYQQPVQEFQA